ncbi:hypothetical protein HF086_004860 [Spodoptera exigua]|uniref:Uncharacterized protein n=1 Tax=Spodoptera exigua TaxID=7107 RepID=A0A922SAH0_SPOEX|nr:hypothetical protein HF086_004860 [Spodoptera exigua]
MIYQGHEFCADPDPPYEEQKKLDVNLDLVNNDEKLYYNANITVKQKLSGYVWRFKIGFEKAGKVFYENDFKGLSCKSFIFKIITGISTIKYDPVTCDIFKGSYSINKLEVSALDKAVNLLPTRRFEDTEAISPMLYRISWRSTEKCTNPEPPYQQDPLISLVVEPYTKNGLVYFRGNLTIKENLKGYYWKIGSAIEKPDHTIKPLTTYKKLTCKSVIPRLTLITSNVKYNERT